MSLPDLPPWQNRAVKCNDLAREAYQNDIVVNPFDKFPMNVHGVFANTLSATSHSYSFFNAIPCNVTMHDLKRYEQAYVEFQEKHGAGLCVDACYAPMWLQDTLTRDGAPHNVIVSAMERYSEKINKALRDNTLWHRSIWRHWHFATETATWAKKTIQKRKRGPIVFTFPTVDGKSNSPKHFKVETAF